MDVNGLDPHLFVFVVASVGGKIVPVHFIEDTADIVDGNIGELDNVHGVVGIGAAVDGEDGNNVIPIVYRGVSVSVANIADHERVVIAYVYSTGVILHALMVFVVYLGDDLAHGFAAGHILRCKHTKG